MGNQPPEAQGQPSLKKERRRKPANTDALKLDRLPPHSIEAEQGILGCILLKPVLKLHCQNAIQCGAEVFYDLRHRVIYQAMQDLPARLDMITFSQFLKDRNQLEGVGGVAYLSMLMDAVPSSENLEFYIGIALEKFRARRWIQICTDIVAETYENAEAFPVIEKHARRELLTLLEPDNQQEETHDIESLMQFDPKQDPDAVIGMNRDGTPSRFLCRGGSALLIGPSGVGKSTLTFSLVIALANATPFCGVTAVKKCRVLIVQAENDKGDNAEMLQGVLNAMGIGPFSTPENETTYAEICERVKIIRKADKTGREFCQWLQTQIIKHAADVVVIDPLVSFAGIDISIMSECTDFLRNHLNPVLLKTGAVLICVHHTGKPPKVSDQKAAKMTPLELSYAGIGSSELVNWARATIVLWPMAETKHYSLTFAKRGSRAKATHPDESETDVVYLRHGADGLLWEQVMPPAEPEPSEECEKRGSKPPGIVQQIVTSSLYSFYKAIPADGEAAQSLKARLIEYVGHKDMETPFDISPAQAMAVVREMVKRHKLEKRGGKYFKGENA